MISDNNTNDDTNTEMKKSSSGLLNSLGKYASSPLRISADIDCSSDNEVIVQLQSKDSFYTPADSRDLYRKTPPPKNISQESCIDNSKSFSIELATENILANSPTASPDSRPKYSEREFKLMQQQMEERMERQSEFLQVELTNLQAKYSTSLKAAEEMKILLADYEQTMERIAAKRNENPGDGQQLIQENQRLSIDLQSALIAFSNLKSKYEEIKLMNEQLRLHEQGLKANICALQTDLKNADERYQQLQKHAEEKMTDANAQLYKLQNTLEVELSLTKAKLAKSESKAVSLQSTIEMKSRENAELTNICDELIGKIDTNSK